MTLNSPPPERGQLKITNSIKLLFALACTAGVLINYNNAIMEGAGASTTSTNKLEIPPPKESHNYIEELMYKYKSDKSRDDHSYVKLYNMIFANIRHSVTNITEIGISHGQSIQAWFRYFPHAEIHGFDKYPPKRVVQNNLDLLKERVHTHIVDILQQNITMADLGFIPESMDIIIDDGPHSASSQETFLQKLFPCLKPGGYYIIEDIGITGRGNGVSKFHDDPSKLQQATRDILEGHDTIWVDTAIGHRAWEEWLRRVGSKWARDTTHHNSYMVVIQKRTDPLREPYQMHYNDAAMRVEGVVVEDGSDT
ncbi:hypothetical protein ACHAWT_004605 [Skeletonema menzelii]